MMSSSNISNPKSSNPDRCIHVKALYDLKDMIDGYLKRDIPDITKEKLRETLRSIEDMPECESTR